MAIVHAAELKPTKLELIAHWLPSRPWYAGEVPATLASVGAFRFDDPAGEVGIQVLLVRAGDQSPIYQIPMTYRGAPAAGSADSLMGEIEHSVLGRRYVYDGCHDVIFVSELVRAVLTGGTGVVEYRHREGAEPVAVQATMHVYGSGLPTSAVPPVGTVEVTTSGAHGALTTIRSGAVEVGLPRVLGQLSVTDHAATLTGEWGDGESACLATVRVVGD